MLDYDGDWSNPTESPTLNRARKDFKRCGDWERDFRALFTEDIKFANADTDNGWQWPDRLRQDRELDNRPTITINKAQQHCLMITNEMRENKPAIKFRPTGNGATYEACQIFDGLARHIEYISSAQVAYDTAAGFQVQGGIGYWRVLTDYIDNDTFDQDIFIRRIINPMNVYLDPDIQELDGSDAKFGFVFADLSKETFRQRFPKHAELADSQPETIFDEDGWWSDKHVRVAEYFRVEVTQDELLGFDLDGAWVTMRKSHLGKLAKDMLAKPGAKSRPIQVKQIKWHFIVGDEVIDTRDWPGIYIPIVRVIGVETVIEGILDRKGHTRAMKDPQRMYNYWSSSAIEHVALQGKTPWLTAVESIEELETYWETANNVNHAYLPYNALGDDGVTALPAPTKPAQPMMAQAYLDGMKIANAELMEVSGQFQAQMGEQGNERTGKAINARTAQSDKATFHYIDNFAVGVCYTGKIILDLIPKIYDTQRIVSIMAEDGTDFDVFIDPQAAQAFQVKKNYQGQVVAQIFNPNVGKYSVQADVGPAYATRRQEAFNALVQIITQAPDLMNVIGDILMKNADFPQADEVARRLKRMVPMQALGEGPTKAEAALKEQVDSLTQLLQASLQTQAKDELSLKGKDELRDLDAYNAETNRIKVLLGGLSEQDATMLVRQLVAQTLKTSLDPVLLEGKQDITKFGAGEGPLKDAQQAPDGNWYIKDPQRPGKYLQVQHTPAGRSSGPPLAAMQVAAQPGGGAQPNA